MTAARFWVSTPAGPMVAEHPALPWRMVAVSSWVDLGAVWDTLSAGVRAELAMDGIDRRSFEEALIRAYFGRSA